MVTVTTFSYALAACPTRTRDDGCMVRLFDGVHLTLWGCGRAYFFTINRFDSANSRRMNACLVETMLNSSSPAEIHRWEVKWKDDYYLHHEVAAVIGKDLTAESREGIATLLSRSVI